MKLSVESNEVDSSTSEVESGNVVVKLKVKHLLGNYENILTVNYEYVYESILIGRHVF